MVKDIFGEIRAKKTQFLAILLITALGVGFFIGIRVTGYNMRLTADQYMDETQSADIEVMHTLGIDDEMIADLDQFLSEKGQGYNKTDAFVLINQKDYVMTIYELNETTATDLTLLEGRMAINKHEALLDDFMAEVYGISLGDEIKIKKNDVFKSDTVKVVGLVQSNLYMNTSRGKTNIGTGNLNGYLYVREPDLKNKELYTTVRYQSEHESAIIKKRLEKKTDKIVESRFDRAIAPMIKELEKAKKDLKNEKNKVEQELAEAKEQLLISEQKLRSAELEIRAGIRQLAFGVPLSGSIDEQMELIKFAFDKTEDISKKAIQDTRDTLALIEEEALRKPLEDKLQQQIKELETQQRAFKTGYQSLSDAILNFKQGKLDLQAGKSTLEQAERTAKQEMIKAEKKIKEAERKVKQSDHGLLMAFERKDFIIGYQEFYNDSERIEAIGKVFPLIFFGVAILVTLSTVSRMIDESRMQIGVYKALGYTWFQASLKYVGFTGLAWLLGSLIGIGMGFYFYPMIIYDAYRIMYTTPDMVTGIVMSYVYLPLIVSFLSSVGVAFLKARQVSLETAANLLRPPLPKAGQRIFLEKIPAFWSRLSFLYKVSLRNLFRNKARFLMTIIGIGGCCGLLITGFGLKHSIYSIIDITLEELIQYDGMIVYEESYELEDVGFDQFIDVRIDNLTVEHEDVVMYRSQDLEDFNKFIQLRPIKKATTFNLLEDPVLITAKLAENNNISIGDELEVELDNKKYQLPVGGIVENYVEHYIYLSEDAYLDVFNSNPGNNSRLFNYKGDEEHLSKDLLKLDEVYSVTLLSDMSEMFDDMLGNFDIIIYVVVGAAFALELIVLLNLITMNISEREKELATLKVLGFYPKELAQYILRENIILTLISLMFGLLFGKFLHFFVVSTAELDMIMFNKELLIQDIVLAMLITFFISVFINLMMAQKANRVNMSEALKTFDD